MYKERLELAKELLDSFKSNREIHEPFVMSFEYETIDALEWLIEQSDLMQELEQQNKRYRELLLKIFKVTQNHQIEKISDYAFSRAGMLFYEWLGASGVIDLDRYCDEVNGHDNYDEYNIERMIDEMIKGRIKLEESE